MCTTWRWQIKTQLVTVYMATYLMMTAEVPLPDVVLYKFLVGGEFFRSKQCFRTLINESGSMKFFNYEPIVNAFLEIRILLHWE